LIQHLERGGRGGEKGEKKSHVISFAELRMNGALKSKKEGKTVQKEKKKKKLKARLNSETQTDH